MKIFKIIVISLILSISICFIFTFTIGRIFNGEDGYIMTMSLAIIFSIFLCTFYIKNDKFDKWFFYKVIVIGVENIYFYQN